MIKKMLERREECNTYLTHVCKQWCSSTSTADEIQYWLTAPLSFLRVLYTMLMSTDVSQVGVALFPSF